VLKHFDWSFGACPVVLDLTSCESANFQAIALLIQYGWWLASKGCDVTFKYGTAATGPTKMLMKMGATRWREILTDDGRDFDTRPGGKTFALRRRSDVQNTINYARTAINAYNFGFPDYLSYIVSELLYNATEHGRRDMIIDGGRVLAPAIFQFGYYSALNRLSFIFSDIGPGIKAHLEQSYPEFPNHQEAIVHALRPNVSGTFRRQSEPYASKDNAGLGLTYSSLMLKRLKGDMYIVSHDGVVHVSPEDITSRKLLHSWQGTFVLINFNLAHTPNIALEDLMAQIRMRAEVETSEAAVRAEERIYLVRVFNYFGRYAEDKDAAIKFRDQRLIPAIKQGKKLLLDFAEVETAPHSFLNAMLATPVTMLGLKAYQFVQVRNASGIIHEIIAGVLESNLPRID
jgi:hypothetical protein